MIEEGKIDDFKTIYQATMSKIRNFEGCLNLELLQSKNDNILMTYSYWESEEALEKYRNSDLFKTTWKSVKPLFDGKPEAWSLTQEFKI